MTQTCLDDRRFLFVTGKGGVGKSTVSAALARAFASRGKRVLLTSCCGQERLSLHFGVPRLGSEIRRIAHRVYGVHLDPEHALSEYGTMMLKRRVVFEAVFNNKLVRSFLKGVPGLYEWAVLGKAWFHSTEKRKDGSPRFDVVIYDAPATGHGLDMLRVPKVILDVAPPGILRRDAERAWKMFTDPRYTGVVVVTLPEDLPTTEALELIETLDRDLGLPVARLVVNAVMEELFSPQEREALLEPRHLDRELPGDDAVACAVRRAIRERVQSMNLERFVNLDVPQIRLPLLDDAATTPAGTERLAALL
jgi:anion-transporting  ArsA/GET3 family ATPase